MVGKITRDDLVTGSGLPTLFGLNPYTKRNAMLRSYLSFKHIEYQPLPTFNGNEYTEWGNLLEPLILNKSGEFLNCRVNGDIRDVYSFGENFFEVSLDGILTSKTKQRIMPSENIVFPQGDEYADLEEGDELIIEAKSTQHQVEYAPNLGRGVLQSQGQHLCYQKAKWIVIAVLYRGSSLRLFMYKPDKEMQREIIERIEDFYKRLAGPDFYPSLDTADASEAYNKSESDLPVVDLTINHKQLAHDYYECVKTIKSCEKLRESYEAELMDAMGLHERAVLHNEDGLGEEIFTLERKSRNYKAQPEKVVPAKPARSERAKKPTIKSTWGH